MSKQRILTGVLALAAVAAGIVFTARAQGGGEQGGPLLPDGKWHANDPTRPQPPVIDPGTPSTQDAAGKPPSDAIVLFDGTDLSKWVGDRGEPAPWTVQDGVMTIKPGSGAIRTKEQFGDYQLHIEWSAPNPPRGNGQDRGNSGVILDGRYEIQVLDSYHAKTYADGQAAGIYGQFPPLVNACRPPGEWQTYDILFTQPRFKDGKLDTPAYLTVFHNGVVVHNHVALMGATGHMIFPKYSPHPPQGPIELQDHGHPVRYRNIWLRPNREYDQP